MIHNVNNIFVCISTSNSSTAVEVKVKIQCLNCADANCYHFLGSWGNCSQTLRIIDCLTVCNNIYPLVMKINDAVFVQLMKGVIVCRVEREVGRWGLCHFYYCL